MNKVTVKEGFATVKVGKLTLTVRADKDIVARKLKIVKEKTDAKGWDETGEYDKKSQALLREEKALQIIYDSL